MINKINISLMQKIYDHDYVCSNQCSNRAAHIRYVIHIQVRNGWMSS